MKEQSKYKINSSNNNNLQEKVFYLPSDDSFVKKSNNPYTKKKQKEEEKENKNYPFIVRTGKSVNFKEEGRDLENLYNIMKGKIRYVICIIMESDSSYNSDKLKRTLDSIKYNISFLKDMNLEAKNILICVFFKEIKTNEIFNKQDYEELKDINSYILVKKNFIFEEKSNKSIKIHCISKIDYFSEMEIFKCFYCIIIKQLKIKEGIIFTSVITAGVEINYTLKTLLLLSFNSKESHNIIVPLIDDCNNDNIIYKIKKYERIHYNIYDLNFYCMTQSIPILSYFNVMTIDDKLFLDLNVYYKNVYTNCSVDFHDYNLSLFLSRNDHSIIYYNETSAADIYLINYYNDLPIDDYKDTWIKRYSGYYGNFFELIRVFIDCYNFNIFKKIFLAFQLIGYIVDFIFPSLSTIIIYTIFYEAFDTNDTYPAMFCTSLYLFFFICSGACSLVSSRSNKTQLTNLILYIFMEVYYLFILICAIIAIHNLRVNENNTDPYKFNSLAISLIIILTFIPSIIPLIIKNKLIIENIIETLLYFSLGASQSTSTYMLPKILNSCEASGGENIKERKGIIILLYFLFNLLVGCFSFFNYTRKKRIDTVMILGICFLVYNFFKMTAIVINLIINSHKLVFKANADKELKKEFKKYDNMKLSSVTMASEFNKGESVDITGLGSINPSINAFGNLAN